MKRAELITAFRQAIDDEALPYLWKDQEVRRYLDDAHREAAERALLLSDVSTAAITQVSVVGNTAAYTLDPRIIQVNRAKLRLRQLPLTITSTSAMDQEHPGWETKAGTPSHLVVDAVAGGWRAVLSPTPAVADTLDLSVFRTPLGALNSDDDAPEIHERYHLKLLDWMMHLAYQKRDSETLNEKKSLEHEAVFTANFGARVDANVQRKQAERRPAVVQMREF